MITSDDVMFLAGVVRVTSALDHERQSVYFLSVLVSDGVHSDVTTLRVNVDDVNDNLPTFDVDTYYFDVNENCADGKTSPMFIFSNIPQRCSNRETQSFAFQECSSEECALLMMTQDAAVTSRTQSTPSLDATGSHWIATVEC